MNMAARTAKTIDHTQWEERCKSYSHFNPMEVIQGYAARYPEASEFTFQYEGGYVNDPDDPGGCTNMGITIGTLKTWRSDNSLTCDDVKNLSKQEAQMIYAQNYWAPIWGNRLPIGVNTQVYDWGVNSGPSRSVRYLQELVGSTADGIMGTNTLSATKTYVGAYGIEHTLELYSTMRQGYYESLSSFSKYGNGWTARNEACLALSVDLANDKIILPPFPPQGDLEHRVIRLEAWAASFQ